MEMLVTSKGYSLYVRWLTIPPLVGWSNVHLALLYALIRRSTFVESFHILMRKSGSMCPSPSRSPSADLVSSTLQ